MKSKEEIIASKLYDLLSDSRIEHYLVGRYIAQSFSIEAYDKFLELVGSARHEKENRIEWLKRAILGDKKMTSFSKKCEILSDLWTGYEFYEPLVELYQDYDISFPLAHAYHSGYATLLSESGTNEIDILWNVVMTTLGLEDTGFAGVDDLLQEVDDKNKTAIPYTEWVREHQ